MGLNGTSGLPELGGELPELLGQGKCVNSRGNVFGGTSAPQKAIDDMLSAGVGGTVWFGNSVDNYAAPSYIANADDGTYDPVDIQLDNSHALERLKLVGMGNQTHIASPAGSTTTGFQIVDNGTEENNAAKWRFQDFRVSVDQSTTAQAIRDVAGIEHYWHNVTAEMAGTDCFVMVGLARSLISSCQFGEPGRNCLRIEDDGTRNEKTRSIGVNNCEYYGINSPTAIRFTEVDGVGIRDVSITGGYVNMDGTGPWLEASGGETDCVVTGLAGTGDEGGTTLNTADILVGDVN